MFRTHIKTQQSHWWRLAPEIDYFKSRAVEANYYGLYVFYLNPADFPDALPRIRFGEFDGTENHNETFTINWPDGTHNKIEFTSEARNAIESMKVRVDDGEWETPPKSLS